MKKNKILLLAIPTMLLTGCGNYQIVDGVWKYDKAICKIGNEVKEIEIKKWTDYEGEQLQIIDKDGNAYLISSYNCTLIRVK